MSEQTTVTGTVHLIEPVKSYGQKGFKKRTIVLTQSSERFVNYLPMDFCGEKCSLSENLQIGDVIKATYKLTGRKWQKDDSSEVRFFLGAEIVSHEVLGREPAATPVDLDSLPF